MSTLSSLADVQSQNDSRQLAIQKVGICDYRVPLRLNTQEGAQPTIARATMTVYLPAQQRGSHLSRFIPLFDDAPPLDYVQLQILMQKMLQRLEATQGSITLEMPYFRRKTAPVSGLSSLMDYQLTLYAEQTHEAYHSKISLKVPVTSLCPCSKEISQYGAHNQRSIVTLEAQVNDGFYLDDLINIAEISASSQLYGVLKRSDEKYITEWAYDHPKFVEDLVRDTALALATWREKVLPTRIGSFAVSAENLESIHNHSAYARLEYPL